MKTVLASLVIVLGVSGCVNPFAEIKPEKPVVKVVKKPSINIFGLSVKELNLLSLKHLKNEKLQGRIKRRIYFLNKRAAELKQVRKEIELGGLKSEFARLKVLRDRYPAISVGRQLINKTLRAIKEQIKKFEKENPVVKNVSRKPASYVEHAGKRAIAVLELKREIRILIMQYNQATGIHKKRLERTIESLQRELSVVVGKIEECK